MSADAEEPSYDAAFVRSLELDPGASVELIGRGWDCDVLRVGERRVVKLAKNAAAALAMERELRVLPLLAPQLPLAVAPPTRVSVHPDATSSGYGVYDWIPGRALCELELEPDDYDVLADTLGRFLRALHGARLPEHGLPRDTLGRLDGARSASTRAVLDQLLWEGALTRGQRTRLGEALDDAEGTPLRDAHVPVHGDLHPCNLLVDEDGFTGVIDWIDLHVGHPAVDLATAYLSLPSSARNTLFEAYGEVRADALAWARWRAVTVLAATVRGAQERGWGERSHAAARHLVALAE